MVRGEAPTTVEAPFDDVTVGVINAVTEVQELANRKIVDDDGRVIIPQQGDQGVDLYLSTSSAGGGLQMLVAGVVRTMTAESAERAALGAGAIVMDVLASNDRRLPHEQITRIRHLRPDMMLLSGGIDGGTTSHVAELAELMAAADPKPRLGSGYELPVVFAGNVDAREAVKDALGDKTALSIVENLRPTLDEENLDPARDKIHDLFMEHVMAQAPGYDKLKSWTSAPVMPTPGAVGEIIQTIARERGISVLGVDIGGATTDIFSVFKGTFNRTVSRQPRHELLDLQRARAEAGIAQHPPLGSLRHGRAGAAEPRQEQDDPPHDDSPRRPSALHLRAGRGPGGAAAGATIQHKAFATDPQGSAARQRDIVRATRSTREARRTGRSWTT